jgi:hypothetical protein
MANNEKVSDLLVLYASDLQSNDILLATDVSARESKKLEVGQLLLFIESSGSFFAFDSAHANTASYISASNIDGIVAITTNASHSISSSWSDQSLSSSHALNSNSASYSLLCVVTDSDTASFLNYTGASNGTASNAVTSSYSIESLGALNLLYFGADNGTASYAISASSANASLYSVTTTNADTSSVSISSSYSDASLYSNSSGQSLTSSLSFTASYFANYGPKFINPVTVVSTTTATAGFLTFNCSAYVPAGTQAVILDGWAINNTTNTAGFLYIRSSITGPSYVLTSYMSAGSGDAVASGAQGTFPILSYNSTSSFQYYVTENASGGATIRLIGYY